MKGGIIKKPQTLFCTITPGEELIPLKYLKKLKINMKKTPTIKVKPFKVDPETTKAIMKFLSKEKLGK